MFCKNCGTQIADDSKFCPNCGTAVDDISKKAAEARNENPSAESDTSDKEEKTETAETIINKDAETEKTDGVKTASWKKIFEYKVYLPVVAVLIILSIIIAKAGQNDSKKSTIDLALYMDYTEEQVAEAFGCEVNELGVYPNEDNINVTCADGKVYLVMLNVKHEDDSKYTIKGLTVGKTLDEEADLLSGFTQDFSYDLVDGIRYAYTEKSNGYFLAIDTDEIGNIIAISYSWDNSTVDDPDNDNQDEASSEADETAETEEITEEEDTGDTDEYVLPDYCTGISDDEGTITHYSNGQSGYSFGLSDYSSRKMYIYEPEKFKELMFKLSELSEYTEAEVVIYEEDELNTNIDDVAGMYMLDNYNENPSKTDYLVLVEFYCTDESIDYLSCSSDSVYYYFGEDRYNEIFNTIGDYDSISIGFADSFTKAFEEPSGTSQGEENTAAQGYSDEELCEMARAYYSMTYGQEPPIVEIDSANGDSVNIHLYEIMDDHESTWDWYTVNRKTGLGNNVIGDSIDLTSVN